MHGRLQHLHAKRNCRVNAQKHRKSAPENFGHATHSTSTRRTVFCEIQQTSSEASSQLNLKKNKYALVESDFRLKLKHSGASTNTLYCCEHMSNLFRFLHSDLRNWIDFFLKACTTENFHFRVYTSARNESHPHFLSKATNNPQKIRGS